MFSERPPIRIFLVDDHPIVRAGLRMLIESQPQFQVVGEASSGGGALTQIAQQQPETILLSLDPGDEQSLDIVTQLQAVTSSARVLLLTRQRDARIHQQAVRLGVAGIVLKDQPSETLIRAIEQLHAGDVWLDRSLMASVLAEMAQAPSAPRLSPEAAKIALLTQRERAVIGLIGEGLKNKQIGARLSISETTVRHHLTSIFNKLDVADRLALVIYAYRHKLAQPPQ
jgi:DNA-binding NarL/FixJ family response regulator